jgi:hypothetical protein
MNCTRVDHRRTGFAVQVISRMVSSAKTRSGSTTVTTTPPQCARLYRRRTLLPGSRLSWFAGVVTPIDGRVRGRQPRRLDIAISECGASIWCDPCAWIPEAARLLRPGSELVFLVNSIFTILCGPDDETIPAGDRLLRPLFGEEVGRARLGERLKIPPLPPT